MADLSSTTLMADQAKITELLTQYKATCEHQIILINLFNKSKFDELVNDPYFNKSFLNLLASSFLNTPASNSLGEMKVNFYLGAADLCCNIYQEILSLDLSIQKELGSLFDKYLKHSDDNKNINPQSTDAINNQFQDFYHQLQDFSLNLNDLLLGRDPDFFINFANWAHEHILVEEFQVVHTEKIVSYS